VRFFRSGASARGLGALGRDGTDAYDLVDRLPRGPARVAAWNAYVCQTYADKLVDACRESGVARFDTAGLVRDLYALVPVWLQCADGAGAPRDLPFPHWHTPDRCWEQLVGMRQTLEALRTYLAFDLAQTGGDEAELGTVDASLETVTSLWIRRPPPELRAGIGDALRRGLDAAYALGQRLAGGSAT
jgi:hypothetical protein